MSRLLVVVAVKPRHIWVFCPVMAVGRCCHLALRVDGDDDGLCTKPRGDGIKSLAY